MTEASRLRGWKSIAAYLRVTQSTAMRWSKQPDFPVIRAGEGGSVYAYPAALDAWLARDTLPGPVPPTADADVLPPPAPPPPPPEAVVAPVDAAATWPLSDRRRAPPASAPSRAVGSIVPLVAILLLVGALLAVVMLRPQPSAPRASPIDPEAQRLLREARAEWAARTPASIARAIALYQALVGRFPDMPAAFTGLADAYILSCEFAPHGRPEAFARARSAAATALALAPGDADALRITGFLTYWTTRDIARAGPFFEQAIIGDRTGYLTNLWYGNALIDAGHVAYGLDRIEQALETAPDSPAVLTDYAIALWQNGAYAKATAILDRVEVRYPQHSSAPGMRALFALSHGEAAAYLAASDRWAALIGDPRQTERLARERAAFAQGGTRGLLRAIADAPPLESPFWHGGLLPKAMATSRLGDRPRLIALLSGTAIASQNWRRLRFPLDAFARWRGDAAVAALVGKAVGSPDPFGRNGG